MKRIKNANDLIDGEWYWRNRCTPVRAVKIGRWMYFVAPGWVEPYTAGSVLVSYEIHGPIKKPA